MAKRVFIIHGWYGYPDEGWFPWLKQQLESLGVEAHVLEMPNPSSPSIETWVPFVSQLISNPDENTYLVGHSIGCQTILRYLQSLPDGVRVGGCVLVAGFYQELTNGGVENPGEELIINPWLQTPIDWENVKKKAKMFVSIFSDNDPWVPLSNAKVFEENLGSKIITLSGKGHFSGDDGVTSLDVVLQELSKL